jgi:hypothetical protein
VRAGSAADVGGWRRAGVVPGLGAQGGVGALGSVDFDGEAAALEQAQVAVFRGVIGELEAVIRHPLRRARGVGEEPFAPGEEGCGDVAGAQEVDDVDLIACNLVRLFAEVEGERDAAHALGRSTRRSAPVRARGTRGVSVGICRSSSKRENSRGGAFSHCSFKVIGKKRRRPVRAAFRLDVCLYKLGLRAVRSDREVHVEFDRVRRHFEALDFFHLQFDVGVDHVVGEDVAGLEEGLVGFE